MAENAAPGATPAPKKKGPTLVIALVAGIALAQGGVLFAVFKFMGAGPAQSHAASSHEAVEIEAPPEHVGVAEVQLLKNFRVPNDKSGRMIVYDMDVCIVVQSDKAEKIRTLTTERAGEVGDRVARVMRAATDSMLREDNLSIIRSQVEAELKEMLDPDLRDGLERVLLPRFVPIPT